MTMWRRRQVTMYGADSDQLRALAREMFRSADDLDSDIRLLSRRLFGVPWLGEIATAFLERWAGICVPNVGRSTAFLRASAETLNRQATEQDAASADDGRSGAGAARLGDLGETYSWSHNGSWAIGGVTAEERGRRVLQQMLDDIFDDNRIAPDEFEIVKLENGKYLVVLPGVADLEAWEALLGRDSESPLGFDPNHRSVRDTDAVAIRSASDASVGNNLYAQYVMRSMEAYGVPAGADVMIVGHSLGGDTGLDLAADPNFNGPNGYNVTHVLAAAYNSEHQLPSVPSSTEVLVIQNSGDRVVAAERALFGPTMIRNGAYEAVRGWNAGDPVGVISGVQHALEGVDQTASDVVSQQIEFAYNVITDGPVAAANDLVTLDEGTYHHGPNQDRIVFHGGSNFDDVGHGTDRYSTYVGSTDDAAFRRFAESVAQGGYDANGTRTVHDVSVPE